MEVCDNRTYRTIALDRGETRPGLNFGDTPRNFEAKGVKGPF